MNKPDRYDGLNYRAMIQWSSRLQREWPFYAQMFVDIPEQSLLDLGCGPGEHCARFAAEGWQTTGVDLSASQIATAREHHPELDFLKGDLAELGEKLSRKYGAAICVGNVMPGMDDAALDSMLGGLHDALLPGGVLVLQQLEYGPILAGKRRSIGPIFSSPPEDQATESVFLRIFAPHPEEGYVRFLPTRLLLHDRDDEPVTLNRVESIRMRARRRADVEQALRARGFTIEGVYGSPEATAHDPESGNDLWVVARRSRQG